MIGERASDGVDHVHAWTCEGAEKEMLECNTGDRLSTDASKGSRCRYRLTQAVSLMHMSI